MAATTPLDHLRSRKRPAYKRVAIPTDTDLADRYEKAKSRAESLDLQSKLVPKDNRSDIVNEDVYNARSEMEALKAELEETIAWFEVRSIGPKAYDALLSKHPPTPDQRQKAKKEGTGPLAWNEDTFIPALIAATTYYVYDDPDADAGTKVYEQLTPEFVEEMEKGDDWSRGDIMTLFTAAYEVNAAIRRNLDLGNG